MPLVVQKYGGTSVGTPNAFRTSPDVCSTLSKRKLRRGGGLRDVGVTDNLIKLARQLAPDPTERELDVLLATGEQTTIALTAMTLNAIGGKAVSLTGAQAGNSDRRAPHQGKNCQHLSPPNP